MVAYDQPLLTIEPFQYVPRFLAAKEHSSSNIYGIITPYPTVPGSDQRLVHGVHIRERASAHPYAVGMAEVCICRKIDYCSPLPC